MTYLIDIILDFPFNFPNGTPARYDSVLEALLYNSSSTILRFHLIAINFPAGSACPGLWCVQQTYIVFAIIN